MKGCRVAGALVAMSLVLATPAQASAMSDAEKIRKLDIMLMVTGLRCRSSHAKISNDYRRFTRRHMVTLNRAQRDLHAELARRHGVRGAKRALDRLNVHMANSYGGGHPWLDCSQLGQVARNLAAVEGQDALVEAAGQILAHRRTGQFAYAKP